MTADAPRIPEGLASAIERARRLALLAGVGGLVLCLVGWIFAPAYFYPAYLFAWMFWLGLSLGSLAVIMLNYLTGGEWGVFVRRIGESAANVLPLLLLLFVPIVIGAGTLYPWSPSNAAHNEPIVLHRAPYFHLWFWLLRCVIYFAVWTGLAFMLRAGSLRHDRTASPATVKVLYSVSAVGLILYFVFVSLGSVDWIMSRTPEWRSTVYGFIICMGQASSAFAFMILMLSLLEPFPQFRDRLRPRHLIDLGNLLNTCIILWAYMSFGQLLIIWLGNMQSEIGWYMPRTHGIWHVLAALLIILHFLVPFFLLLQRKIKTDLRVMRWICLGVLLMRMVDLFWNAVPSGSEPYERLPVMVVLLALAAVVGIGGLWLTAFLTLLGGGPIMPLGETVPLGVHPTGHGASAETMPHGNTTGTTERAAIA